MERKPMAHAISSLSEIEIDCIGGIEIIQNENTPTLFLFAVYLPADSDIRSYGKCYDDLNTLFTYYRNYWHVAFV